MEPENTEGVASSAKDSKSDENGRRSATERACTKASAERDAEYRIRNEYLDGEGDPPQT